MLAGANGYQGDTHSQATSSKLCAISYHVLRQAAAPEARIPSVRAQVINPRDMH